MNNTQIHVDRKIEVANVTVGDVVECQTPERGTFNARIEIVYDHSAVVEISKRERTVVQFKNMIKDGNQVKVDKMMLKRTRKNPNKVIDPNAPTKKTRNRMPKRRIEQWTLDGNYINSFDTIVEANKHFGLSSSGIAHCLKGNTTTSLGYKWKYAGDEFPKLEKKQKKSDHLRKSVLQLKDGIVIKEYASIKEAAKEIGVTASAISASLRSIQNKSAGFEWKYKKE